MALNERALSPYLYMATSKSKVNNKSSNLGGARPGAGRKPGKMEQATLDKIRALELYKAKIRENAEELFELQMKAARNGDNRAIESMLDRAFGKATQPISGAEGEPPVVTLVKFIDGPTN